MHPLVRAAIAVAVLTALSSAAGLESPPRTVTLVATGPEQATLSSVCPKGSLPDSTHCVPFVDAMQRDEGAGLRREVNAHRDRSGQWRIHEQIPRRPDRPADYTRYRYPIDRPTNGPLILSGYGSDRQGGGFDDAGYGGVDLGQDRGAPVRALRLPHQQGDTQVVFVGKLFGNSIVTRHTVAEAGRSRDYLLVHGRLDATNPKLGPGATAAEGTTLGFVGDSGSEGRVHLYFQVRQVRDGVEASMLRSSALADRTVSIVCDPRNVLPVEGKAAEKTNHLAP